MTLSLNVLNHLGINLYSNVAAVVAETVANSWDADAEHVDIQIGRDTITISDDGHGMTVNDINAKYLCVGYQKREHTEEAVTPRFRRSAMGRKGIGKLSLFSIAETIVLESVRDGNANGLRMRLEDIRSAISTGNGTYRPENLSASEITVVKGTKITLTDLKKRTSMAVPALRRRMARRFSIIGPEHQFTVNVNGSPISVADRDYFHKLQYLWHYGSSGPEYVEHSKRISSSEARPSAVGSEHSVSGWIGTAYKAGDLKDEFGENLNRIVVMVRGKLAQEDILESFNEGGVYSKYLIGEIHADFLDVDAEEDIATSNRQRIIEDDARYVELQGFIRNELKHIQNRWTELRNDEGTSTALEIPVLKEWFESLPKDQQRSARSLFGKINQLPLDSADDRRRLMKHAVLAFESFKYRSNLKALESITPEDLPALAHIFRSVDDIEATLYYQIVRERIAIIRALREKVEENALERVIQEHIFEHLWLLDTSWERASATEYMEQRVETEFGVVDETLTPDEKAARLDIKYRKTSGAHVIIELKRADRQLSSDELLPQVRKYRNAMGKVLSSVNRPDEPIEIVCVVGKPLRDWSDKDGRATSAQQFAALDARVVQYQELLESAYAGYSAYIEREKEAGRIFQLVSQLDDPEEG